MTKGEEVDKPVRLSIIIGGFFSLKEISANTVTKMLSRGRRVKTNLGNARILRDPVQKLFPKNNILATPNLFYDYYPCVCIHRRIFIVDCFWRHISRKDNWKHFPDFPLQDFVASAAFPVWTVSVRTVTHSWLNCNTLRH